VLVGGEAVGQEREDVVLGQMSGAVAPCRDRHDPQHEGVEIMPDVQQLGVEVLR
jgi:hypothetical protein